MRMLAALPLMLALAMPTHAQAAMVELTDAVPGASGITYLDLVRIIAPDLEEVDGAFEGKLAMPVRNLAYAEDPPIPDLPLSFYSASATAFTSNGTPLVALLLDADAEATGGPGAAVLAIFDPARPEAPIDVADVASDQHTGFAEPALLPLGQAGDGLLISSSHSNSSQGYRFTSLLALNEGKLAEMASVFTLNENYCGMLREQTSVLAPADAAASTHWAPFTITVTETTTVGEVECDLPELVPGTRAVTATFGWNEATGAYEADNTALDDLLAETEARF